MILKKGMKKKGERKTERRIQTKLPFMLNSCQCPQLLHTGIKMFEYFF